ncbi:cytochrome c oxidase subunit II [Kineosporia sp. NBRC 101731]|uniref:aa3-type cytochrome oxidase subunit II n=1 Tax=Kineosporia sp. NBRC 101731 TaxID=3032199 RepID=UPI0024A54858|nr:cytochrome c oxidase subunit II [Kineosporia sp. NBRC 101731]GLY32827.1 cytochrome c oxidase subunit II [Kineosporia sp. NBRC 101731]
MKHSAKALGAQVLIQHRDETVGRPPLRSHEGFGMARRRARAVAVGLTGAALLTLSGCTDQVQRGWLPSTKGTTNQTTKIMDLWVGSWIAALIVGVIVWGLTIWCMIVYRRRKDETGFPAQIRYHLPLEVMYTIIPVMMVAVLFGHTASVQSDLISTDAKPDVTIGVVGKQWSWDFNYKDSDVYETGVMGQLDGNEGAEAELPTLYLPVNQLVQFDLTARDVIHSFWVPAFLMKMDTVPGVQNKFQVRPQRTGTFKGKCAELCGEYHSEMLFNVKVVSQADYDRHMAELEAQGNTGQLGEDLNRSEMAPSDSNAEEAGNSSALPATKTTAEVK